MEDSVFTRIMKKELPAEFIYEDDTVFAILNRFPNIEGETLVIPKKQVPYLFDLDDDMYRHLMDVTKTIAKTLDTTFGALRTCVVVEGFDVPHVHIRLYPVTKPKLELGQGLEATDDYLATVAAKIRTTLA